jgi:regulation of enolase protein 1 (concanavalin A-like superfamily)
MDLRWLSEPEGWDQGEGMLRIVAGPNTDWFADPGVRPPVLNAPALVGPQTDPFRLSARVRVEFTSTYDAGALVVYANEHLWAKLCLERRPHPANRRPTDGHSDRGAGSGPDRHDLIWVRRVLLRGQDLNL